MSRVPYMPAPQSWDAKTDERPAAVQPWKNLSREQFLRINSTELTNMLRSSASGGVISQSPGNVAATELVQRVSAVQEVPTDLVTEVRMDNPPTRPLYEAIPGARISTRTSALSANVPSGSIQHVAKRPKRLYGHDLMVGRAANSLARIVAHAITVCKVTHAFGGDYEGWVDWYATYYQWPAFRDLFDALPPLAVTSVVDVLMSTAKAGHQIYINKALQSYIKLVGVKLGYQAYAKDRALDFGRINGLARMRYLSAAAFEKIPVVERLIPIVTRIHVDAIPLITKEMLLLPVPRHRECSTLVVKGLEKIRDADIQSYVDEVRIVRQVEPHVDAFRHETLAAACADADKAVSSWVAVSRKHVVRHTASGQLRTMSGDPLPIIAPSGISVPKFGYKVIPQYLYDLLDYASLDVLAIVTASYCTWNPSGFPEIFECVANVMYGPLTHLRLSKLEKRALIEDCMAYAQQVHSSYTPKAVIGSIGYQHAGRMRGVRKIEATGLHMRMLKIAELITVDIEGHDKESMPCVVSAGDIEVRAIGLLTPYKALNTAPFAQLTALRHRLHDVAEGKVMGRNSDIVINKDYRSAVGQAKQFWRGTALKRSQLLRAVAERLHAVNLGSPKINAMIRDMNMMSGYWEMRGQFLSSLRLTSQDPPTLCFPANYFHRLAKPFGDSWKVSLEERAMQLGVFSTPGMAAILISMAASATLRDAKLMMSDIAKLFRVEYIEPVRTDLNLISLGGLQEMDYVLPSGRGTSDGETDAFERTAAQLLRTLLSNDLISGDRMEEIEEARLDPNIILESYLASNYERGPPNVEFMTSGQLIAIATYLNAYKLDSMEVVDDGRI